MTTTPATVAVNQGTGAGGSRGWPVNSLGGPGRRQVVRAQQFRRDRASTRAACTPDRGAEVTPSAATRCRRSWGHVGASYEQVSTLCPRDPAPGGGFVVECLAKVFERQVAPLAGWCDRRLVSAELLRGFLQGGEVGASVQQLPVGAGPSLLPP